MLDTDVVLGHELGQVRTELVVLRRLLALLRAVLVESLSNIIDRPFRGRSGAVVVRARDGGWLVGWLVGWFQL